MNDTARQKLSEIITKHGDNASNPRHCEGLLRDYCGQYPKEIFLLVNALHKGVASELIKSKNSVSQPIVLARLTRKLQDELGITEESALWAVDSWGLGLGVISEPRSLTEKDPDRESNNDEVPGSKPKPNSKITNIWAIISTLAVTLLGTSFYASIQQYSDVKATDDRRIESLNREYQNYKNSLNDTEKNIANNFQSNISLTKESHVNFCNQSSSDVINVALMYHEASKGSTFKSKGWWAVKKGSCENISINIAKNETAIYIHGQSKEATWGSKDFSFCVDPANPFDISNANKSSTCTNSTVNANKFIIIPGMNTYVFKDY
jgi:uncharacterized membrane protein